MDTEITTENNPLEPKEEDHDATMAAPMQTEEVPQQVDQQVEQVVPTPIINTIQPSDSFSPPQPTIQTTADMVEIKTEMAPPPITESTIQPATTTVEETTQDNVVGEAVTNTTTNQENVEATATQENVEATTTTQENVEVTTTQQQSAEEDLEAKAALQQAVAVTQLLSPQDNAVEVTTTSTTTVDNEAVKSETAKDTTTTTTEGTDDKKKNEERVKHFNSTFCSCLNTYYASNDEKETKENLFEGVLLEYLKLVDTEKYRVIFQTLCKGDKDAIKRLITVDIWERCSKYVDEYLKYKFNFQEMPRIFSTTDLSSLPKNSIMSSSSAYHTIFPPDSDGVYALIRLSDDGNHKLERISLRDLPTTSSNGQVLLHAVKSHHGPTSNHKITFQPPELLQLHDGVASNLSWQGYYVAKLPEKLDPKPPPSSSVGIGNSNIATDSTKKRKRGSDGGGPSRSTSTSIASCLSHNTNRVYLDGDPTNLDVRFGRGGGTNNHKGNILYLLEKLKLQPGYNLLATQRGKKAISQRLVDSVHNWGGRFVAKDDKNGQWYVVDDSTARRKASQTLREDKSPFEQNSKRVALTRKLTEIEQALAGRNATADHENSTNSKNSKKRKSSLTFSEQKVGETLLELTVPRDVVQNNDSDQGSNKEGEEGAAVGDGQVVVAEEETTTTKNNDHNDDNHDQQHDNTTLSPEAQAAQVAAVEAAVAEAAIVEAAEV